MAIESSRLSCISQFTTVEKATKFHFFVAHFRVERHGVGSRHATFNLNYAFKSQIPTATTELLANIVSRNKKGIGQQMFSDASKFYQLVANAMAAIQR